MRARARAHSDECCWSGVRIYADEDESGHYLETHATYSFGWQHKKLNKVHLTREVDAFTIHSHPSSSFFFFGVKQTICINAQLHTGEETERRKTFEAFSSFHFCGRDKSQPHN